MLHVSSAGAYVVADLQVVWRTSQIDDFAFLSHWVDVLLQTCHGSVKQAGRHCLFTARPGFYKCHQTRLLQWWRVHNVTVLQKRNFFVFQCHQNIEVCLDCLWRTAGTVVQLQLVHHQSSKEKTFRYYRLGWQLVHHFVWCQGLDTIVSCKSFLRLTNLSASCSQRQHADS